MTATAVAATDLPTRAGVRALTALAGLVMPALTGIVDLILRARIP